MSVKSGRTEKRMKTHGPKDAPYRFNPGRKSPRKRPITAANADGKIKQGVPTRTNDPEVATK